MSGWLGVRLLPLLGCVCLWLPGLALAAVVISEEQEPLQDTRSAARSLQKRSPDDSEVEVRSVTVDCVVTSRFAHTVMTSLALNKANVSKEIFFEVQLPKTAFITNFSMEIEGKVYVGEVKEKEKAKEQYEKAVSSGQTAGLVKASGRKMEKFSVSVNVAANSNVTFTLTYEELLQRKLGQYEILTRVKPKSLVQDFKILTNIYEPQGIAFLSVNASFLTNDLLLLVDKTVTDKKAHISFSPTVEQQRTCPHCDGTIIDGDFVIKYDVHRVERFGDIQVVNGYFVHFFAPPDLPRVPKNIVFVTDHSGSMAGRKLEQSKEALMLILDDLHEEDYFTLMYFDDTINFWRDHLSKATEENVGEGKEFVNIHSRMGGTNINGAVLRAVDVLNKDRQRNRLPERSVDMIILLTDGMPTVEVSDPVEIQKNVQAAIAGKMSLFCLGFGNDVEYSFLDVMSKQNKGVARRIYEASDAVLQLQGFYNEIASPLLFGLELHYPDNSVDSLTMNTFDHLFDGSEIVVAGRLTDNDLNNFLVEVLGQGSVGEFKAQGQASTLPWNITYPKEEYIFGDFTERLWAYLTIQQLLDKSKTGDAEGKANAEALKLSLQYGFVTSMTSMVVTKPETEFEDYGPLIADKLTEDERQEAERHSGHLSGTSHSFSPPKWQYDYTDPDGAPLDQDYTGHDKGASLHYNIAYFTVDGDPHFIIELKNDALCFNINDKPGTIFTLINDTKSGIVVNGQTIGDKKIPPGGKAKTYFGKFGIIHKALRVKLEVSTRDIKVFQDARWMTVHWSNSMSLKGANIDLLVTKDRSLTVTLKDSVKFVILLHQVWAKHPYHQDYLGFYTLDSHLLSHDVHGLLGQFFNGVEYEVSELRPGEVLEKPDATMYVKGHELNVTRGWQRDFRLDIKNGEKVPCWFIHNNGSGLIDGEASDYIVSSLF